MESYKNNGKNVDKLERSILELGTEIYRLKIDLNKIINEQRKHIDTIKALCKIVEEKDLSTEEEIELISDHLNEPHNQKLKPYDLKDYSQVVEKIKKNLN